MRNISKRVLALAIALVMVIGLIPVTANHVSAAGEAANFRAHEHYTNKSHEGWTAWSGDVTPADANWAEGEDYYIYLSDDTTLKRWVDIRKGQSVTICLCGHTLTDNGSASGRFFRISGGATVTIVDCTATGNATTDTYSAGRIVCTKTSEGSVAGLYNGDAAPYNTVSGRFYMYDGIVQGRTQAKNLIYAYAGANVGIYGGKMMNNENTTTNGGAIYAKGTSASVKPNVVVSDTAIVNNFGFRGGAIHFDSYNTAVLENVLITGNSSTHWGCVTLNSVNTDLTLKGTVKIYGNTNPGNSYKGIAGIVLQHNTTTLKTATIKLDGLNADSNVQIWSQVEQAAERDWATNPPVSVISGDILPGTVTYTCLRPVNGGYADAIPDVSELYINAQGKIDHCAHSWTDATCIDPMTCSVCGHSSGSVNPNGHYYGDGESCLYCNSGLAVAKIGDTEYGTVEEAVEAATAGQTVTLALNARAQNLNLNGITLDLNGKTLTATSVAAMNGQVIDSVGTGLLKVAQNAAVFSSENEQVAVWNGENGYLLTDISYKVKALKNDNGTYKIRFIPVTSAAVAELLKDGSADNSIAVKLKIQWNGGAKTYAYSSDLVAQLYTNNNGVANTDYVFTFTFTGVENFEDLAISAYVAGAGETVADCSYVWEVN